MRARSQNIDEYIENFSPEIRKRLTQMRKAINEAAPDAVEAISYAIPTFKLKGNLVHFAGLANHIGFYPGPAGIEAFSDDLSGYRTSKGAIQFPHKEQLPLDLVKRIVQLRVKQNLEKDK